MKYKSGDRVLVRLGNVTKGYTYEERSFEYAHGSGCYLAVRGPGGVSHHHVDDALPLSALPPAVVLDPPKYVDGDPSKRLVDDIRRLHVARLFPDVAARLLRDRGLDPRSFADRDGEAKLRAALFAATVLRDAQRNFPVGCKTQYMFSGKTHEFIVTDHVFRNGLDVFLASKDGINYRAADCKRIALPAREPNSVMEEAALVQVREAFPIGCRVRWFIAGVLKEPREFVVGRHTFVFDRPALGDVADPYGNYDPANCTRVSIDEPQTPRRFTPTEGLVTPTAPAKEDPHPFAVVRKRFPVGCRARWSYNGLESEPFTVDGYKYGADGVVCLVTYATDQSRQVYPVEDCMRVYAPTTPAAPADPFPVGCKARYKFADHQTDFIVTKHLQNGNNVFLIDGTGFGYNSTYCKRVDADATALGDV